MVAVFERSELTTNEEVLHIRCKFERVAVGNNDVGGFADLERAQLVRETEDLRRIKRDGLEALFRGETVGDGVGGVLAKATGERIVKTTESDFHACCDELSRLAKQTVVRIVFFVNISENGPQNNWNILGTKKILHFVSFFPAGEDHAELLFVAIFDGISNVASAICKDKDWKLAAHDGNERFELYIAFEIRRTAVTHGLGVVSGAIENFCELIDLLFVICFRFCEWFLFARESREVKRLSINRWPVNDHRDASLNLHFVDGPTRHVNCGCLACEQAASTERIKTTAARNGKDFRYPRSACHRNVFTRGKNGSGSYDVRIEWTS